MRTLLLVYRRSFLCISTNISRRLLSTNIDFSHEKPHPEQLDHVQRRVTETVPLMFKQRLDYTFYRADVICDDQIFRHRKQGLDQLMQHLGMLGVLGQLFFPHIDMEVISVVPMVEDGTVRCRWRVKYVSFFRLFTNLKLLRYEYRLNNLSWYDGYSIFTVDGNGHVYKLTIQKTQQDDSRLLNEKSSSQKLAEKIAIFRPGSAAGATHFVRSTEKKKKDKNS